MKATHLAPIELNVAQYQFQQQTNTMKKVEIWEGTLNAVNALLYGKDGADLSGIINDMCPCVKINENSSEEAIRSAKQCEAKRQLIKLNIGLAFNGIKPAYNSIGFRVERAWNDSKPPRIVVRKYAHVSFINETAYYFASDVLFGEKSKDVWEIVKTENGNYVTTDGMEIENNTLRSCSISDMDDDLNESVALATFAKFMKAYREKNQAPSAPAQ